MLLKFTDAQLKVEVYRIIAKAKETSVLVTDVAGLDGSGSNCVPAEVLQQILAEVAEQVPNTTVMIVVAGDTKCQAMVYSTDKIKPEEWLQSMGMDVKNHYAELPCSDGSSLKKKDELIGCAFAYLRKHKLLDEHDSDDETFVNGLDF